MQRRLFLLFVKESRLICRRDGSTPVNMDAAGF